jgi:transposase
LNTIAASMARVGLATQPVINLMRDALLDADLIYCDETTFQVLKEKGRKPQTTNKKLSLVADDRFWATGLLLHLYARTRCKAG